MIMIPTLKVLASLLQLHGQGTAIQSDHQGISALLNKSPDPIVDETTADHSVFNHDDTVSETPAPTQVYFRRAFGRGGYYGGGFRRGGYYPYGGGFRRGFARAY
jgi:hypothetical protein